MPTFEIMLSELRAGQVDPRPVEIPIPGLAALLEGAQREGKVAPDLDPLVLATALWNGQHGVRAFVLRTGDTEMANAVLEILEDLVARTATSAAPKKDAGGR